MSPTGPATTAATRSIRQSRSASSAGRRPRASRAAWARRSTGTSPARIGGGRFATRNMPGSGSASRPGGDRSGSQMSVARHTVYNIAGAAVPVLVSLVTVPAYLSVVGFARYGILAICWLMLGYFNLFDLGLGRAVSQKLASLEAASPEERSRVFWTAIYLSGALIAIAVLLFFPVSWIVLNRMHFDAQSLRSEVLLALPWLTATVAFGIANGVVAGPLDGRRRLLA